jgi:hypothetical protein
VKFGGLSSQGLQKPEKRRYDGGTRTPGPPISENPGKRDPEQPRAHTGYKAWFRGARMPADQRELIHESRAEIEGHEERKRRRQSPDVCLSSRPPPAGLVVALDPFLSGTSAGALLCPDGGAAGENGSGRPRSKDRCVVEAEGE